MDVFQFLDPYAFMKAYYQHRKDNDQHFSYNLWAEELNVQSSSTLRMMVSGEKKLSPNLAEKFSAFFASEDEKNFFRLLVTYAHAINSQEKAAAWGALSKILVKRINQTEAEDYFTYLSDLLLPKLQTLLSFDDLSWSENNLAQVLRTDTATIAAALQTLASIDMAESSVDENGCVQWKAKSRLVKVSDKLGDLAVRRYHDACLDEAKRAQDLAVESRRYRSLLLPVSAEEYQALNGEVDAFVKQLLSKYQSDHYKERRLYKINLNYFPVTEEIDL